MLTKNQVNSAIRFYMNEIGYEQNNDLLTAL